MHGDTTTMQAARDFIITTNNISEYFSWLPSKLTENGYIFLESCNVGVSNAEGNIQLAFAALTLDKPQVKIIAPNGIYSLGYFELMDNHDINAIILKGRNGKDTDNIAYIADFRTKEHIRSNKESFPPTFITSNTDGFESIIPIAIINAVV